MVHTQNLSTLEVDAGKSTGQGPVSATLKDSVRPVWDTENLSQKNRNKKKPTDFRHDEPILNRLIRGRVFLVFPLSAFGFLCDNWLQTF